MYTLLTTLLFIWLYHVIKFIYYWVKLRSWYNALFYIENNLLTFIIVLISTVFILTTLVMFILYLIITYLP
jgi:hypothetical protein